MATKKPEAEALAAFAARVEEEAQPLAVCQITHPDAVHGAIHEGKYAGIRLVKGDGVEALLSDGSVIPPRVQRARAVDSEAPDAE